MFKWGALVATASAFNIPDFVNTVDQTPVEEGFNMFEAVAQMSSLDTCPWTTADYTKYAKFPGANKLVKDYDSCVQVVTWKITKADLDQSGWLNRCEWALACIGEVGYTKGRHTTDEEAMWCIKHSQRLTYDMVQPLCHKMFG